MAKLIIFPEPLDSMCILSNDFGFQQVGTPDWDADDREGVSFDLPANYPQGNGAVIQITKEGYNPLFQKGILWWDDGNIQFPWYNGRTAALVADDFHLSKADDQDPDEPDDLTGMSPFDIIMHVWNTGEYELFTKEGCGLFTEACVDALNTYASKAFGHLRKDPGQNQFNGHAVDALNFIGSYQDQNGDVTPPGIYDIIYSSESHEAKPVFNFAGPAEPEKWYYPAAGHQDLDVQQAQQAEQLDKNKEDEK